MSLLNASSAEAIPTTGETPLDLPDQTSAPSARWPGYQAPWPAYMLADRHSKRELIEQARARTWFHGIDLGGGFVTPGPAEPQVEHIRRAFLDVDFAGKSVLDIGCWDGGWSFEAEKRGAVRVVSTDLISQRDADDSNYKLAHAILNSRARYLPRVSVYNVHTIGRKKFDIVLYMGVFYHLKDPLLALARLRQVTREGGVIIVEGEVIKSEDCFATFYYNQDYARSSSNWWVPSIPCLREWIECSHFRVENEYFHHDGDDAYWEERNNFGRYVITARAIPIPTQDLAGDPKNFYSRYDFLDRLPRQGSLLRRVARRGKALAKKAIGA